MDSMEHCLEHSCFGKVIDQLLASSVAPWLDVPTICALESTSRELRRVLVLDERAHERLWRAIAAPDLWLVRPRHLWTTPLVYQAFKAGECDVTDHASSTNGGNDGGGGGGAADAGVAGDRESGSGNNDEAGRRVAFIQRFFFSSQRPGRCP